MLWSAKRNYSLSYFCRRKIAVMKTQGLKPRGGILPAAVIVVALLLVSRAAALVDFPIGYASLGGTYGFIALIQSQKLLEKEGIQPKFVYIGGPQISQALIAGDIQMAIVAAASPIIAAAQGADIRIVGGVTDREVGAIVADAKITKPAELKGTRMAIDRLGDYTDFRARKVLKILNLEPQKDVFLLQIGGQTARFASLRSGQVQSVFVCTTANPGGQTGGIPHTRGAGGSWFSLYFRSAGGLAVDYRQTRERGLRRNSGGRRSTAFLPDPQRAHHTSTIEFYEGKRCRGT